jgi:hypothetical protein
MMRPTIGFISRKAGEGYCEQALEIQGLRLTLGEAAKHLSLLFGGEVTEADMKEAARAVLPEKPPQR